MKLKKKERKLIKKLIREQANFMWQKTLSINESMTLANFAHRLGLRVG